MVLLLINLAEGDRDKNDNDATQILISFALAFIIHYY
jgi:hypothetical protein